MEHHEFRREEDAEEAADIVALLPRSEVQIAENEAEDREQEGGAVEDGGGVRVPAAGEVGRRISVGNGRYKLRVFESKLTTAIFSSVIVE